MIIIFFVRLIVLFTALPIHEYAHGYVAYKMGDPTAKWQGRLTLNPFKHLDIVGSIAILFLGIGWAKPVEINPRNFRNPKKGMAISALAGPVSNLLIATLALIIFKLLYLFPESNTTIINSLANIFSIMISVNISLAIFNLLPIPPLDGSRIAGYFLPEGIYFKIMQYEQIIFIGLLLLMTSPILSGPLNMLNNIVFNGLDALTGFVDVLVKLVA